MSNCTNRLYGAETWGKRSAERRKINILKMKCFRSLVGVSRMARVMNEEVRRRAGIERELTSRADQRVLTGLPLVLEVLEMSLNSDEI